MGGQTLRPVRMISAMIGKSAACAFVHFRKLVFHGCQIFVLDVTYYVFFWQFLYFICLQHVLHKILLIYVDMHDFLHFFACFYFYFICYFCFFSIRVKKSPKGSSFLLDKQRKIKIRHLLLVSLAGKFRTNIKLGNLNVLNCICSRY